MVASHPISFTSVKWLYKLHLIIICVSASVYAIKKIDISEKVGHEIYNVYSSKNNIIFETEEMYIVATMGELLNSII